MSQRKYNIGIDEAGRGPLAGPVTLAGCRINNLKYVRDIAARITDTKNAHHYRDSKKLSPQQREDIYKQLRILHRQGYITITHTSLTAHDIDTRGLSYCLRKGVARILKRLSHDCAHPHKDINVLLDGRLYAPKSYIHQQTITKGDTKELSIALASIVAKVIRDRIMVRLSNIYPEYGFDQHKGYGTQSHYGAIKKFGISKVHRRSFLRDL